MFSGNQQVILYHLEMRNAIQGVLDFRVNVDHIDALPVKAHDDLYIKIHALPQLNRFQQFFNRYQRITAKSAHTIGNVDRQGIDPYAPIGKLTAV